MDAASRNVRLEGKREKGRDSPEDRALRSSKQTEEDIRTSSSVRPQLDVHRN